MKIESPKRATKKARIRTNVRAGEEYDFPPQYPPVGPK